MLVRELERKLKKVNPDFHIRYRHFVGGTYGGNIAGVFLGSKYLHRIPQGFITRLGRHSKEIVRKAQVDDVGNELTPAEYRRAKHRGYYNLLKLLRSDHLITQAEFEWLINPNT